MLAYLADIFRKHPKRNVYNELVAIHDKRGCQSMQVPLTVSHFRLSDPVEGCARMRSKTLTD